MNNLDNSPRIRPSSLAEYLQPSELGFQTETLGADRPSRPVQLPSGVAERLLAYEQIFNITPGTFQASYLQSPIHYSLESGLVVTTDPNRATLKLAGVPAIMTGLAQLFGYTYFHVGLVLNQDRIANQPHKRTTLFGIDTRAMKGVTPDAFVIAIECINHVGDLSNHDPLHAVNGIPQMFRAFDGHLRFGGVEFAPILLHAEFVHNRLEKDPSEVTNLEKQGRKYLEAIANLDTTQGPEQDLKLKFYYGSIYLRHLLLVLPHRDPVVQNFLAASQEILFQGKEMEVDPNKFRDFLRKNFSTGPEADPLPNTHPAHLNRVIPYNHGRNSFMTPYLREQFAQQFGPEIDNVKSMPCSSFLLLDTFRRGHGIYSCVSTQCESGPKISVAELAQIFART